MIVGDTKTVQALYDLIPGSASMDSGMYSSKTFLEVMERLIDLLFGSSLLVQFRRHNPVWYYQVHTSA